MLNRTTASIHCQYKKCLAVAEMGDRLATIDMGRKVGAVPDFRGKLGPSSNTMTPGRRPT